jgi:hypothetical protein
MITKTAHKFKWTEEELQNVANNMYKQMTSGKMSTIDFWPAFKAAQFSVNPSYKYSVNYQNTDLMKELRVRVTRLFNNACKAKVEVKEVINKDEAKKKAIDILTKIATGPKAFPMSGPEEYLERFGKTIDANSARRLHMEEVCAKHETKPIKTAKKFRELLTGNIVEECNELVTITITTNCPKKWVLVDLETGEQFGSNGTPVTSQNCAPQAWVKPVRRVTIPKPTKAK